MKEKSESKQKPEPKREGGLKREKQPWGLLRKKKKEKRKGEKFIEMSKKLRKFQ